MISCRHSTEWVIKNRQGNLFFRQKVQLWLHLLICKFCRRFAQQSTIIDKAAAILPVGKINQPPLSSEEKQALVDVITRNISS